MNDHLDAEALSAYIDEEVDLHERERIDAHIGRCSDCQRLLEILRGAASAISRLEDASVTPDEHRLLRQAVLDARPGIRRWGPMWGLAGVTALVVVGVFGFFSFQRQGSLVDDRSSERRMATGPVQEARSFDFVSDEQIRSVVSSQGQVVSGIDRFTVADVGTEQEPAIHMALSSTAAATIAREDKAAEDPAAGRSSPSADFSSTSGQICIRKVLRSQPYPMIPLLAAPASYKQKTAWLLVYAFTADQTSTSRLDRAQIWLISPEECARLEGAALINAAYHYSFYKKP